MKKLLITSVLSVVVVLTASTAFGQGYVTFGGGGRTVWSGGGSGFLASPATGFDATFLWAPSTVTSALVDGLVPSTPTSSAVDFSFATAWSDIEGSLTGAGGSWTFATTNGVNVIGAPASSLAGSFSWNGGVAAPIDNIASGTYSLFVIAWSTEGGVFNTLPQAEAEDAPVGWSAVFQYAPGAAPPAIPPPVTDESEFGIDTPEPTTLALAGLGALSMLFLRSKKA